MKRTLIAGTTLAALSIAAGIALLLLPGCAALQDALDIRNPSYSLRDVRPRIDVAVPLSASTIDIDFALRVDNPNRVGLRLDGVDFDLLVNDRHLLRSASRHDVRIPANGIGDVWLHTRIGYDSIRSLWNEVAGVIQGKQARYTIRGTAHYDTPAGRLSFPLTVYSGGT